MIPRHLSIVRALKKDPKLFEEKRILAIGDIALDKTLKFEMKPGPLYGHHQQKHTGLLIDNKESVAVGSVAVTPRVCASFHARSHLITAFGEDDEGDVVEGILERQRADEEAKFSYTPIRLKGVKTVTRLRFFETKPGCYECFARFDKEERNYGHSYDKALAAVRATRVGKTLRDEIARADGILVNDTGKGFLSRHVLDILTQMVNDENKRRDKTSKKKRLVTVVDPKQNWNIFFGFPTTVFKCNFPEARYTLFGDAREDPPDDSFVTILGQNLCQKYGPDFPCIVMTLGHEGAAVVSTPQDAAPTLNVIRGIAAPTTEYSTTTHCGDVFGSEDESMHSV